MVVVHKPRKCSPKGPQAKFISTRLSHSCDLFTLPDLAHLFAMCPCWFSLTPWVTPDPPCFGFFKTDSTTTILSVFCASIQRVPLHSAYETARQGSSRGLPGALCSTLEHVFCRASRHLKTVPIKKAKPQVSKRGPPTIPLRLICQTQAGNIRQPFDLPSLASEHVFPRGISSLTA